MSKLFISFFLLFSITCQFSFGAVHLTARLAEELGLYKTIDHLRIKSNQTLDKLHDDFEKKVQDLQNQDEFIKADVIKDNLIAVYKRYSDAIDKIFDNVDRKLITKGNYLDNVNAPLVEKENFIEGLKQELKVNINNGIKQIEKAIKQ